MTSLSSYGGRALAASGNADWVHARFDRAVDIVQSLPRSGPIQTNYDDKLLLYSVYKQATEGDIKASRPGLLDVLGRAKWDAWNKRKGLSTEEAERLYVQGLLKILKGYSDRPQATELIRELENFSLDPRAMVLSGSLAPSDDDSTSSTEGDAAPRPLASSSRSQGQKQQRRPAPPPSSHRGQRSRAAQSTTSASVAPSLPGYGPPRTRADSPRRGGDSSSSGTDDDYSSAEEEQRSRRAYQQGPSPHPPQQYAYSQHGQQQQLHPPAPTMPNRVLSPPLHPSQYPQHPHLHHHQQQAQHPPFPPPPQSFRGGPSPGPSGHHQQMAVAYPAGVQQMQMQRPPSLQPQQQQVRPPSTTQPPPGLDAALDRIQTSLTALHERLAELERSRLSSSALSLTSSKNPDSPLALVKLTFLRLLVVLHLRSPSAGGVVQLGLGRLLLKLLMSFVRAGRRVLGDLGVALVVVGLLSRITGRGDGAGVLLGRLLGAMPGLSQVVLRGRKERVGQ